MPAVNVDDPHEPRGRLAAEDRLICAAAELLGEVGPRAMSVRMVAERAGVNHGLVHHYFGGKHGLMRAAMTRLVEEHARYAKEQSDGRAIPAPLALSGDQKYLRAVVRAVLDDEMELARTELDEGVSIPRGALEHARARAHSGGKGAMSDVELKASVAVGMALEMGWAALEPFLFAVADVSGDERDQVRDLAKRARREIVRGVRTDEHTH